MRCALLEGGAVRCWGENGDGQLGYGHTNDIGDNEVPSSVGTVSVGGVVTQLAAGYAHTCALLEGGTVRCWGMNFHGQLGYGHTSAIGDNEVPSSVSTVNVGGTVTQLAAGEVHTCALLAGGALTCWGSNSAGELGYGHTNNIGDNEVPSSGGTVDVGGVVTQVAAGAYFTCALLEGGAAKCWGNNGGGQLGYGNTVDIGDDETPVSVAPLQLGNTRKLTLGGNVSCALLETAQLTCWGTSIDGALGLGGFAHVGDDEHAGTAGDVPLQ